ncbi:MAG TPA: CRISPR system precrRNA processing endoribonuclease RAMP protein Cas6 [Pirellula sp.]|nr:CRISPR system precrRNA processing endoribonuclease RAMP protein Cas6 [Pirellula sp.]
MNSQPMPFPSLRILKLRATLRWRRPDAIPGPAIANVLRGALGITFRKLVCPIEWFDHECHPCSLYHSCAYGQLFMPKPTEESGVLQKQQDAPRPFVIEPPGLHTEEDVKQNELTFRIVLFGTAVDESALFLSTLIRLCQDGIGRNRTPLDMVEVIAEHPQGNEMVLAGTEAQIHTPTRHFTTSDFRIDSNRALMQESPLLTIHFTSPLLLKAGSGVLPNGARVEAREVRESPAFGVLISRLRDRLSSLSAFFGERWQADFRAIGDRANSISIHESKTVWLTRNRRSTRTGQAHAISGLVGHTTYRFDNAKVLEFFLPLLRIGELIHVGKNAPWGNGGIRIGSSTLTNQTENAKMRGVV